jgi:hypothetical protein
LSEGASFAWSACRTRSDDERSPLAPESEGVTEAPSPPSAPRCAECKAWARKVDDPDGVRRCFGHSIDPVCVAKREAAGAKGAAAAERQRGLTIEQRRAVEAGVVPIEQARAETMEAKQRAEAEPVPLKCKDDVLSFLGSEAGVLRAGGEASRASAAAGLARAALAALGADLPDPDDDAVEPRSFSYETTTGEKVALRGRGDRPVH